MRLVDAKITLKSDYGTVVIPVQHIRRIDFATRTPPETAARIQTAIANLASGDFKVREAASAELLSLDEAAYVALQAAVTSQDAEVVVRAERLLDRIRELVPAEYLEVRNEDLVFTEKSQISGVIETESLDVDTAAFGRQKLQIAAMRKLLSESDIDREPSSGLPDPGTLTNYRNQIGKSYYFTLTGPGLGGQAGVWGSDIYTYDSNLAMCAVHAGVLRPGQTKIVGVTIVGPQEAFGSSNRNGINSQPWGSYPSGFRFKASKNVSSVRR